MKDAATTVTMLPLLMRARDVAAALAISESLVAVFVRRGWLTPVRFPTSAPFGSHGKTWNNSLRKFGRERSAAPRRRG